MTRNDDPIPFARIAVWLGAGWLSYPVFWQLMELLPPSPPRWIYLPIALGDLGLRLLVYGGAISVAVSAHERLGTHKWSAMFLVCVTAIWETLLFRYTWAVYGHFSGEVIWSLCGEGAWVNLFISLPVVITVIFWPAAYLWHDLHRTE